MLVFIWSNSSIHKETVNSCLIVVVQSLNHVKLFATPWTAVCLTPLSSTVSQSLLKFMSSLAWFMHSIFLCNIVLHSIRLSFHHQTHPQLSIISDLAQPLHSSGPPRTTLSPLTQLSLKGEEGWQVLERAAATPGNTSLYVLTSFPCLTSSRWSNDSHYAHYTDEETEVQKGRENLPGPPT